MRRGPLGEYTGWMGIEIVVIRSFKQLTWRIDRLMFRRINQCPFGRQNSASS